MYRFSASSNPTVSRVSSEASTREWVALAGRIVLEVAVAAGVAAGLWWAVTASLL